MRKVITGAMVSLDGVMQAPGGPHEDPTGGFELGGWVWPFADEVFGKLIDQLLTPPYELLLGRKTYEIFAAYWPYQSSDNSIAKNFNAVTKYVATRSGIPLTWEKAVALRDAATEVARLKKENGPNLLTQGSSDLLQTLLGQDLIDELHVFTFPVLLGRGKRLFGAGTKPAGLKLVESRVSTTGVMFSSYQRAGAVANHDPATKPPSEAELKRREKLKRQP